MYSNNKIINLLKSECFKENKKPCFRISFNIYLYICKVSMGLLNKFFNFTKENTFSCCLRKVNKKPTKNWKSINICDMNVYYLLNFAYFFSISFQILLHIYYGKTFVYCWDIFFDKLTLENYFSLNIEIAVFNVILFERACLLLFHGIKIENMK